MHIMLCFCFVFLRLVYPMLPVSLDCPFLVTHSAFSTLIVWYLDLHLFLQSIYIIDKTWFFFTVDATKGTGTVFPSGASDFNVKIVWVLDYLASQSFDIECTWARPDECCSRNAVVCIFSVVHWLYCLSFNLRLLISTLASSNIYYMW